MKRGDRKQQAHGLTPLCQGDTQQVLRGQPVLWCGRIEVSARHPSLTSIIGHIDQKPKIFLSLIKNAVYFGPRPMEALRFSILQN
jgi:hypothetical protein